MSAQHAAAVELLERLHAAADSGARVDPRDVMANIGMAQAHALLEAGEQLEALVELLRPLVEQGETGQDERPDLTVCPRCLDGLEGRTVRVTTPGDYVVHEDC